MNSWTGDVDEDDGDDEPESIDDGFEDHFRQVIEGDGTEEWDDVTDISEVDLVSNIDAVEDEDLLRQAWLALDGEKQNVVKNRIEDLTGEAPDSPSDQSESEDAVSGGDETESDETESSSDSDDSGWGGDSDSADDPEPTIESGEDMDEEQEDEEPDEPDPTPSDGPPTPSSSLTPTEMAERERRWKVMVWGPPKLYKTHFGFTMPEPIAFLDLEGKSDDLIRKFQGKDIRVWQPKSMEAEPDTKFRRAKKCLDEAMEWLDWHYEENDERGTIVVDSMTLVWEWAQTHHKLENYPLKDPEDVDLSANFQSSQESDWAVVKEYHNGEFREVITDSPYHFYWTAMERESFEETLEDSDNRRFMEPKGEPDNDYKVDTEIHARKDKERGKVGDLQGSNYVDNSFVGMKKPTFPKVRDAVESIERAESSDDSISRAQLADEIGAEAIIDYDPQVFIQQ